MSGGNESAGSASVAELLVDTDVFIDVLRGTRRLRIDGHGISYSVITRTELFAGRRSDEELIRRLLSPFRELVVDRAIGERAGRLRQSSKMETPDALVAATALEHGLELTTRNTRDFAGVPGLRLRDPTQLAE